MGYTGKQPAATALTGADIAPGSIENSDLAGSITDDKISNLSASKLTGSVADARIPASAVTQHVTATDLSPIENDVAVLALQNAINGNMTAHGLSNYWIEQFEDSDSITGLTNCARYAAVYMSSVTADHGVTMGYQHNLSNSVTPTTNTLSVGTLDIGGGSFTASGRTGYGWQGENSNTATSKGITFGGMSSATRSFCFWFKITGNTNGYIADFRGHGGGAHASLLNTDYLNGGAGNATAYGSLATNTWHHAVVINSSTGITLMSRYAVEYGVWQSNGVIIDNLEIYDGTISSSQVADVYAYTGEAGGSSNATGSFTSTTITPQDSASKSSLGLCLLYKNNAGTNTLNTDIIAKVSADNGSNYSTCVLASKGTFSTGINIAIAPAISVTSGNQLKYKIEFANQDAGGKYAVTSGMLSHTGLSSWNASQVVDGTTGTSSGEGFYVASGTSSGEMVVDLGSGNDQKFTKIRSFTSIATNSAVWTIAYSDNGSAWTNTSLTNFAPGASSYDAWFDGTWTDVGAHRYWKMFISSGSGGSQGWQGHEIEWHTPGKEGQIHGVALSY